MALSITPSVGKWLYQTDAFTIIFKAYDDNGIQCRNNQMSIQYNIAYDGAMPDLTQMKRVYSDASGIITLVITKPCVISLYGIHVRDVNDPSKGEAIQTIAMDYKITFNPVILELTATYTGSGVPITENFNGNNLSIKAKYSDNTVKSISPYDCVITDYQIQAVGENIKSLSYTDPLLGTVWTVDFIVIGVPKLLYIEAVYTGIKRVLGSKILPEEIIVYGTFLISQTETETTEIHHNDWYFITLPVITESNKGIFKIGYKGQETNVTVPYESVNSLRLNVWYEGDKIEVGKSYNPENVIVYLVYPDGERIRIPWNYCQIDSYLVTNEGWNWYTITYMYEFEQIKQEFAVEGIIYKEYIDLDFKVLYITDRTNEKEENQLDLTEEFKNQLMFGDELIIDWNQFLMVADYFQKYGLYIVTVPKLSGLSNKYDMDWEVLCINKTTIKANIKKIYNEEEQSNGEKSNNRN